MAIHLRRRRPRDGADPKRRSGRPTRSPSRPRIDVDLGLRASTAGASREGANIRWNTLSPSILGTYRAINDGWLTFLAGYAEYDARLPLNYLAFGDPHALTGSVHRWNDVNADRIPQAE